MVVFQQLNLFFGRQFGRFQEFSGRFSKISSGHTADSVILRHQRGKVRQETYQNAEKCEEECLRVFLPRKAAISQRIERKINGRIGPNL